MNIYPITLGSLLIIINILIGWFIIKSRSEDAEELKRLEEKYKNSDKDYEENSKKYDTWTEEISKESFKARNKEYLEEVRKRNEVRKNDTFFSYVYFVLSIIMIIILISSIYLIYFGITNINIHSMIPFILGWLLMIIAFLYLPIGFMIGISHNPSQYAELIRGIIVPSIFLVFLLSSTYLSDIKSNIIATTGITTTTEL